MNNFNSFVDCEALRAQGMISLSSGAMRNIFSYFSFKQSFFYIGKDFITSVTAFLPFPFQNCMLGFWYKSKSNNCLKCLPFLDTLSYSDCWAPWSFEKFMHLCNASSSKVMWKLSNASWKLCHNFVCIYQKIGVYNQQFQRHLSRLLTANSVFFQPERWMITSFCLDNLSVICGHLQKIWGLD